MKVLKNRNTAVCVMIICVLAASLIGGWRGTSVEYHKLQKAFSEGEDAPKQYLDTMLVRFDYLIKTADQYGIQTKNEKSLYSQLKNTITAEAVLQLNDMEDKLYASLKQQALKKEDASYLERDHTMFLSAAASLTHLDYNQKAKEYNSEMKKFPASLFCSIFGFKEALVFA